MLQAMENDYMETICSVQINEEQRKNRDGKYATAFMYSETEAKVKLEDILSQFY